MWSNWTFFVICFGPNIYFLFKFFNGPTFRNSLSCFNVAAVVDFRSLNIQLFQFNSFFVHFQYY